MQRWIIPVAAALLLLGAAPADRVGPAPKPWTKGLNRCPVSMGWAQPECFNALAVSPDGSKVAVGTHRDLTVWDVAGRKLLWTVKGSSAGYSAPMGVAFSPDGRWLAAGAYYLRSLYAADDGAPVLHLRQGLIPRPISRSDDGRLVSLSQRTCDKPVLLVVDSRGKAVPAIGPVDRTAGQDYARDRPDGPRVCPEPEHVGPTDINLPRDLAIWSRGDNQSLEVSVYQRGRATPLWTRRAARNVSGDLLARFSRDGSRVIMARYELGPDGRVASEPLSVVDSQSGAAILEINDCRSPSLIGAQRQSGFLVGCRSREHSFFPRSSP